MIELENLCIDAGGFHVRDIHLRVATGGYAVLMGRTGSGKTTLLEALCGLRPIRSGTIRLMDRDVTHLPPAERQIGYVPQDKALFRTMTVREHLAFALTIRRAASSAIAARVRELSDLLSLSHLLDRTPRGLSGGEAQRVSLGRALSFQPQILLLDEPLTALDDQTREEMYVLLENIRHHTGVTTLHVTHHYPEAERLADQILTLENGKML